MVKAFKIRSEEKDGCAFLWQGFHGTVDVVKFSIFNDKKILQVALGYDHCLFLTRDGDVYACGKNNYGQLGIDDTQTTETHDPVLVKSLKGKDVIQISCGSFHSAAVTKDGDVFCWGRPSEGQCGVLQGGTSESQSEAQEGENSIKDDCIHLPKQIQIVKNCDEVCEHGNSGPNEKVSVVKVVCGKSHTVALSDENELWVWGSGLALGVENIKKSEVPIQVETLLGRNVLDINCGELYTVALVERSVLDETPKKRLSHIEKTQHKYFPTTCAKCNEEIYSYTETQDTCIITESHVCEDSTKSMSSVTSDQSEPLIQLQDCVQSDQSEQLVQPMSKTSQAKDKKLDTNVETSKDKDLKTNEVAISKEESTIEDKPSEEKDKVKRSSSDEDIWKKRTPDFERSLSSKSEHHVFRSKSFLNEENARKFLAKQLDKDETEACPSSTKDTAGSVVMEKVGGIWSSVQTGSTNIVQTAYSLPQQMTGMLGNLTSNFLERMSSVPAVDDKQDSGSSIDSNIHLMGFDTSDEDVFHATQKVEHQLSQDKDDKIKGQSSSVKKKSVTLSDSGNRTSQESLNQSNTNIAETTFVESLTSEMNMKDENKGDNSISDAGRRGSEAGEVTPKYRSMRTILAKQEELERKVSTRSSTTDDEMRKTPVTMDTEVWSWGKNKHGQLGTGDMIDRALPTIVKTLSNRNITKLCCGTSHTMALTANSQVYSWGNNTSGQLGRKEDPALPVLIKMVPGCYIWDIAAGDCFSIFLIDRAGIQPEVFFVGKHPTRDLYVPIHSTNRLTSLNFLKQAGWIRSIVAGGDNSCCISCCSFHSCFMTEFELVAAERKFYFYLHKILKLLLDPLQKSSFYTSLDVYPYKSTLQNLVMAFTRILKKISESLIEMTNMIRNGQDLTQCSFITNYSRYTVEFKRYYMALSDMLAIAGFEYICKVGNESLIEMTNMIRNGQDLTQCSFITNYSRYTVEFKRYYMALSDMLAIAGFEYICKVGKNMPGKLDYRNQDSSTFFDSEIIAKSLKELLPADTRIERSSYHFLLIQILESPITHMADYITMAEKLASNYLQDSEEFDMLHRVSLNWSSLRHSATTELEIAETTRAFWEGNTLQKLADAVKIPSRRLVKDSKKKPLVLQGGGRFTSHLFLLFNDMFIHVQGYNFQVFQLETAWIEAPSGGKLENVIVLTFPEDKLVLTAASTGDRAEWLLALNAAVNKVLSSSKPVARRGSMDRLTPPDIRQATFTFTKHGMYKEATYTGYWMSGKVHGLGQMKWTDGRKYNGNFKEGFLHGHGKLVIRQDDGMERSQEGHWKEGQLHGIGKVKYSNGDVYDGHFKEGQRHGHGVYHYGGVSPKTTSLYIGEWYLDKRQGYGVLDDIMKGEKYMGLWHEDTKHGKGVVVTLDGMYFEGNFDRDNLMGFGLMLTYDNSCYEGEFYGITQLQGKGKLIMPSGDYIEGTFSGTWNEGLKINGMFKKTQTSHDSKKTKMNVHIPSSHYGKMSVPADRKWEGMFHYCRGVFGVKGHEKPDSKKAWDGVAVMVSKGRQVLHEMKMSGSTKWKKYQSSFVEEIEKIPPQDKTEPSDLTIEYYGVIKTYLFRAFEISFHPLGKLMDGLVDVFRAAYIGVGAHPRLLGHAVAEINSYVKRIYSTVRILFPALPDNGGPLQIRSERYVSIDSDEEHDGLITDISEKEIVSAGSLLHPILLPKIYPPLFDLYALYNDKTDEKYWERVQKLNKQGDIALMAYLGVEQKFWLLEESFFTNKSSSLSNVRDHCYISSIEKLQQISTAFSPKEKLQVISDSFTEITETVKTTLGEDHIWCMDELFPIFQYVVVRAKIRHLGAEVHFIEDLMERYLENGELGIMFTTLYACYYQIQNEKIPTH